MIPIYFVFLFLSISMYLFLTHLALPNMPIDVGVGMWRKWTWADLKASGMDIFLAQHSQFRLCFYYVNPQTLARIQARQPWPWNICVSRRATELHIRCARSIIENDRAAFYINIPRVRYALIIPMTWSRCGLVLIFYNLVLDFNIFFNWILWSKLLSPLICLKFISELLRVVCTIKSGLT